MQHLGHAKMPLVQEWHMSGVRMLWRGLSLVADVVEIALEQLPLCPASPVAFVVSPKK